MRKNTLILVAVVVLLMLSTALFGQTAAGSHATVMFKYDFSAGFGITKVKASGSASIDVGDGKPTEMKYDSLARLIDEFAVKGWDLTHVTSFAAADSPFSLLIFQSK